MVFVGPSNIPPDSSLAYLLLEKFLVLFVLLRVLLQQLSQACVELVTSLLGSIGLALLCGRLWPVEKAASSSSIEAYTGTIAALIYA